MISKEDLSTWLIENGLAEEKSGYGHVSGDNLAEKLLEKFIISPRDADPFSQPGIAELTGISESILEHLLKDTTEE